MTVSTHLMFQNGKAAAALDLYRSVFPGFSVTSVDKYGPDDDAAGQVKVADLERAFEKLAVDGTILMPLGDYGFSTRFGWLSDAFGVSWQLNLSTAD